MANNLTWSDPRLFGVIGAHVWAVWFLFAKVFPLLQRIYVWSCRCAKNPRDYGEWAIVTGGTDGIGKEYCAQLAEKGINIVIISRSEPKCQAVEKELQEKYKSVKFTHLAIDFGSFDEKAKDMVRNKIDGMDVGILINNVGFPGDFPKFFYERAEDDMCKQVEINITATLWMTRIVLGDEKQGMVARKRGAIINIGSGAGFTVGPLVSLYGAAKAYVLAFTKSLSAELEGLNIHVQVQCPGRVVSQLTAAFAQESLTFPNAEKWVRSAMRQIGYESVTFGYWPHEMMNWLYSVVPEKQFAKDFFENHKAMRDQGMQEAKAKKEAADLQQKS